MTLHGDPACHRTDGWMDGLMDAEAPVGGWVRFSVCVPVSVWCYVAGVVAFAGDTEKAS